MRKIDFRWFLMVSGPRDPKNRVRHQILRILVVGELRGMSFSDLMQNCATNRLRQVLLAPTIHAKTMPSLIPSLFVLNSIIDPVMCDAEDIFDHVGERPPERWCSGEALHQ